MRAPLPARHILKSLLMHSRKTATIQPTLTDLIEQGIRELNIPDHPSNLYQPVSYTLGLAGKRIRPRLVLLGCGLCGGNPKEALPAALAIELLHNFTLIHDDIMDQAETRRGQPSVYRKWDSATAILAGDAMFALAIEQFQYYGEHPDYDKNQYRELYHYFIATVRRICEGQMLDLDFADERSIALNEYENMIQAKTAALLQCALQTGGVVAGAGRPALATLGAIGMEAGLAFQIQDDLLDIIADFGKFGKTIGGDIREGKKTYPALLALARATGDELDRLLEILNPKTETSDEEVGWVIACYDRLNVIEESRKVIRTHYENALEHLSSFEDSEYLDEIRQLLQRLSNREY